MLLIRELKQLWSRLNFSLLYESSFKTWCQYLYCFPIKSYSIPWAVYFVLVLFCHHDFLQQYDHYFEKLSMKWPNHVGWLSRWRHSSSFIFLEQTQWEKWDLFATLCPGLNPHTSFTAPLISETKEKLLLNAIHNQVWNKKKINCLLSKSDQYCNFNGTVFITFVQVLTYYTSYIPYSNVSKACLEYIPLSKVSYFFTE